MGKNVHSCQFFVHLGTNGFPGENRPTLPAARRFNTQEAV
jgi:hypothetical protein